MRVGGYRVVLLLAYTTHMRNCHNCRSNFIVETIIQILQQPEACEDEVFLQFRSWCYENLQLVGNKEILTIFQSISSAAGYLSLT